jgi:transcriptional regulator with XRE-family HTH domain
MAKRSRNDDSGGAEPRIRIGSRLREARKRRELTIDQVATATGLNRGFLSQVERDLATPSVGSLLRICAALRVRIGDLFDEQGASRLVRAKERPAIQFGGVGARDELLTPGWERRIQTIRLVVEPGGHSTRDSQPTSAEAHFVHVTKGEFEISLVTGEVFRLKAGDSLTFSGQEEAGWRNPSRTRSTELLWVITPSLF